MSLETANDRHSVYFSVEQYHQQIVRYGSNIILLFRIKQAPTHIITCSSPGRHQIPNSQSSGAWRTLVTRLLHYIKENKNFSKGSDSPPQGAKTATPSCDPPA